jgi:hypothetical protein
MPRFVLLLMAALALPAFAQTTDSPPLAPVDLAATPMLVPEMTPTQRLEQFRHDEINLLALRGDPPSLLAAALMASADEGSKTRPAALKSPALLKRAQKAGSDDALVWWVTAATECHGTTAVCPSEETLQKLETLDAENAAVWTLSLWRAQQSADAVSARAALVIAAQAKRYDDHFGALISDIYQAQGILPISADLLGATGEDVSADGYRLTSAAGFAAALALPGYKALGQICKSPDPQDTALVADCVAVAHKMELSGSINSQNMGLSLKMALLPLGSERDIARMRQHNLAWQTARISELAGRLTSDDAVTRVYVQALQESGDESAAVAAVLRSMGVALEPPVDWKPPQSDAPTSP